MGFHFTSVHYFQLSLGTKPWDEAVNENISLKDVTYFVINLCVIVLTRLHSVIYEIKTNET